LSAESPTNPSRIDVAELVPMQDGFRRSIATLQKMLDFVRGGGKYDPETLQKRDSGRVAPIVLNRFENGRIFLHDGLHRAATILAGRESGSLYADEYRIDSYSYQEYDEINLAAGYLTPFDPRREVRVADLRNFQTRARSIIDAKQDLSQFVHDHRNLYARPRRPFHASLDQMVRHFHPDLLDG
jgi:hypothetical protein